MFRHLLIALAPSRPNCLYTTSSVGKYLSPTVAYLKNSCGLPPEKAASVSKLLEIQDTGNADSVFELLRSYGFTHTQLGELVSRHPFYVLADAETNLKPKMQYLVSIGISRADLPQILFSNKSILSRNLKNHIAPTFDFLKENLSSYEYLICAIRQSARFLRSNVREYMVPNLNTLRDHGVPEQLIAKLMASKPLTLMLRSDTFKDAVKRLLEFGFQPTRLTFILALNAFALQSKKNWENKRELFTRFGWSKEEFLSAFRVQPMMMLCSEAKLRELTGFFVDTLGLEPSQIAKCPNLFLVSMKKRVIPRCTVLQVLLSNGLVEKSDVRLVTALNMSSVNFMTKYLSPFQEAVPDVLEAYKGKVEFRGFTDKLS